MKKILMLCMLVIFAYAAKSEPNAGGVIHDGTWWQSVSKEERVGFLAGYIDCRLYDSGEQRLANASWNLLEPEISRYFSHNLSEKHKPVAALLMLFAASKGQNSNMGGETSLEKHGIFDGDYWSGASLEHRLGFVEGYLECQRDTGKPSAHFSLEARWYMTRISQWYGLKDDDPSEVDPKRESVKIAKVLYIFRNAGGPGAGGVK